jgi:predicted ATPase/DNA-binding SARP family transcriptional activator
VHVLGGFAVWASGRRVPESAWRLRKARSLVKLLALTPGQRLHREQVIDLLWPDLDPKAASHNLGQTCYVARRALASEGGDPGYLSLQGEVLSLSAGAPVWTDLGAFSAAVARARESRDPADYRAALDLYRGDLLPDDRFEDWASDRRESLRREHLALLVELAGVLEARGELAPALEALARALASDPAHEGAHQSRMRLLALSGRRQEALRQYRALTKSLRRELDAEPDPVSVRLYRDVLEGRLPPPATTLSPARSEEAPPQRLAGGATARERAPSGRRGNLPARLSSFVGRGREIAQVGRMLAHARLLTLTGAGGCGKTALALAAAAGRQGEFPDGVWLVELAALSDPSLVPHTVARALGLRDEPGRSPEATLAEYLRSRRILLLLDNCEQLAEACAGLAERLLRACPDLRILATSREPLRSEGELTWVVPSLSLPDSRREPSPESLAKSEAVRLFVDRARAHLPEWDLGPHNAGAVARVCRRLDGIPLAIELAAARVNILSVDEIAMRLDDCFALLTGGSRTALPRQQSLKATVDWSYALLSEPARVWFRRMGAFAGSFTLEAAAAVCDDDFEFQSPCFKSGTGVLELGTWDFERALALLGELVDKSLAIAEPGGEGTVRYRLLEPLRQYAWRLLVERGEGPAVQRRHGAYYAALAESIAPYLLAPAPSGVDQRTWFNRLAVEHDNLRAAIQRSLEAGYPETALRLGGSLWVFWTGRGHRSEGLHALEAALAQSAGAPAERRAPGCLGAALLRLGAGDPGRAEAWIRESLVLYRQLGETRWVANCLHILATVVAAQGDFERSRRLVTESVALLCEVGDRRDLGAALVSLAVAKQSLGDPGAESELAEGFQLLRVMGDHLSLGISLENSGFLACLQGNFPRAAALATQGLAHFRALGDDQGAAGCLEITAIAAGVQGRLERAARLFGAAAAIREAVGSAMLNAWQGEYERNVAAVRAALGEEAFAAAWALGRRLTPDQAIDYAATP